MNNFRGGVKASSLLWRSRVGLGSHFSFRAGFVILLVTLTAASSVRADEERDPGLLTLDRIYDSREFELKPFSARWHGKGLGYTTLEDSADEQSGHDIVFHDAATGERKILVYAAHLVPDGQSAPLSIDGYSWSATGSLVLIYTNSQRVWRQKTRGDYWILDRSSHELRKLGGDAPPASLMFAKIAPTARQVAYVRDADIYVEDLDSGSVRQITQRASENIINGTFDWVYEEELSLRDGFRWSPDGERIAFWQLDTSGVREVTLVNNTQALYPQLTRIKYPKVGQQNPASRIGVVKLASGDVTWMKVPGDPRNHYLARMEWTANSHELVLKQLNRLQNRNRVMFVDVHTGKATTIFDDEDEAWLDVHDEMMWLSDGRQFTWVSERDGWRHVYLVSRSGNQMRRVTPGDFDVTKLLRVDESRGWLYFLASPDNPTQRYLYRGRLDGSDLERVTPDEQDGTHVYQISPHGQWAIHTFSSFDRPPVTQLVSLPEHKTVRMLSENEALHERVEQLRRQPAEFFRVDIGEALLDAWCIKPPKIEPDKKYPLLVFVYGEPAGQTVLDRWSVKNYLWHQLLAQRGYVVMSFDNRGTPAPRGRTWRKSVHRQIGVQAPRDQAAAVRTVLEKRDYLDADRVAVWGWSGGGSMSLNAIFKYPELYQTAIAIAPVPNQRYYDTIYQERYMGLPNENVEGFLQGSPVNFANQLKGNLLLIHGTGDDNCHYQGTEALINELIRHNKRFTLMAYPNRTHAIREGKNTTRHLRDLMTWYLMNNLPPGPRG